MRVILCPNPFRDKGMKIAQEAGAILEQAGAQPVYCFPFMVDRQILADKVPVDTVVTDVKAELPRADMLV